VEGLNSYPEESKEEGRQEQRERAKQETAGGYQPALGEQVLITEVPPD